MKKHGIIAEYCGAAGGLAAALLLLIGCATPHAPQWQPPTADELTQPLTLEKCLELARKNDIRVAEWRSRLEAARAGVTTAKTLPNPTFTATWENVGLKDPTGVSLLERTFELTYPLLYLFWERPPKVAVAKAAQRTEEKAVKADQRRQAIEVGTAFYNLVADQRRVILSRELNTLAQESLRLAQKRKELGLGSQYDVDRANAEVLQTGGDLADAESQLRLDQLAFAFALGADRPVFPQAVDPAVPPRLPQSDGSSTGPLPESLVTTALVSDHEWAKARAAREAAEADLRLQRRTAIPLGQATGTAGPKYTPEGRGWLLGFEVPIPLFDRNQGGIRKAQAALLAAQTEEEKVRRGITASLSDSWERACSAVRKWEIYAKPLLENLRRNQRAAAKLFAAGQVTYTDMLQAQRDLEQAQLKEIGLWKDAVTTVWTLDCTLGKHD